MTFQRNYNTSFNNEWAGFSKLNFNARIQKLVASGILRSDQAQYLITNNKHNIKLAETFIENAIGFFELPLGICKPFIMNNKIYVAPLAVEETSIIAAISKTATYINSYGTITTKIVGSDIIGQIQFAKVPDLKHFIDQINANKHNLIKLANEKIAHNMVNRGGGVTDILLNSIQRPDGEIMATLHLHMNCCNSMGANLINQVLEFLKPHIEAITQVPVTMCILSNLNDTKITQAEIVITNIDPTLGNKIAEASLFAELDPYRAATHNKGIFNSIDALMIATGNDWRAVEAGAHAYACKTGQYKPLSTWQYDDGKLIGRLEAPIIVGIVGGVTKNHPSAKLCLEILKVETSDELSQVAAALGLMQNFAALRALCTEGITQGHMQLHINNILIQIGANDAETALLKPILNKYLAKNRSLNTSYANQLLTEIRQKNVEFA